MAGRISRRELMRMAGAAGLAAGLGNSARPAAADALSVGGKFQGSVLHPSVKQSTATCPTLVNGKIVQPPRELTVLHRTDVLVVGGGPGGVVAAIAAARAGAQVTLVERYGHLGGLWTGGLVLIVLGHIAKGPKQVCLGIGEEMMRRLDKIQGGVIGRQPGVNPTVDAEVLKHLMLEMANEAGVKMFFHCWGVDVVMDGNRVCGAVFESKSGRQAILAKAVVDATGDGDLFAAAGAEYEHCKYSVGLVSRIGNLDRVDKKVPRPKRGLGSVTPIPGVNWVNMLGPEADALNVAELSELEIKHREFIWQSTQKLRATPGFEQVYLMETAPQLGVRVTRLLRGVKTVKYSDYEAGTRLPDVVAVGGSWHADHIEWDIPYGALVPRSPVENILAAGRCISYELKMADPVRVIPICWVTGQAAGVAAALAVQGGCTVCEVEVPKLQQVLRKQEAYLG
jgi:hypothetical protein